MTMNSEHPKTRKARLAIAEYYSIRQKIHELQAKLSGANIEATRAVNAMRTKGENEPWADHWMNCEANETMAPA